MTSERIAHLRALCENATPGPWRNGTWRGQCHLPEHGVAEHGRTDSPCVYDFEFTEEPGYVATTKPMDYIVSTDEYGKVLSDEDAAFIAEARTALPEALDAIERVRKLAEEIRGESLGEWDAGLHFLEALEGKASDG